KNWRKTVAAGNNTHAGTKKKYPLLNTFIVPKDAEGTDALPFKRKATSTAPLHTYDYDWMNVGRFRDVQDQAGIPGQGNPDPLSIFSNHVVAQLTVGGVKKLYDPSYGIIWADVKALDNGLFDFYGTKLKALVVGAGKQRERWVFRENPTGAAAPNDLKRDTTTTQYAGARP